MSEIETTPQDERQMLARTFEAIDMETDGRNLEMLCVPFDVPAMVIDPPPFGDGQPYEEQFARGAFAGAVKAPNRTLLEFEHWHPGLSGIIGHAAELEERPDALYGRFRVTEHTDGDKALALVKDKVLTAASVFFEPIKSARSESGAMRRLKVKLDRVALCRVGTWPQAQVLAVRTESVVPEMDPVLPFDPELAEYLSAQGIAVPDRLRAQAT